VWKASIKAAESMDLWISQNAHDKFGGEFVACRASGDAVRVQVSSLDERHSRVSARVEPGDRTLATMLQERHRGETRPGGSQRRRCSAATRSRHVHHGPQRGDAVGAPKPSGLYR
jgi:hypothetical protein